ncbi:MAG: hypothetical protein V1821_03660 [bacterium]
MNNEEPTIQDVLEAISDFSTHMEKRFDGLESHVANIESRVTNIESRVTRVESTMVTKDYLDEKLGKFRGDVVAMVKERRSIRLKHP